MADDPVQMTPERKAAWARLLARLERGVPSGAIANEAGAWKFNRDELYENGSRLNSPASPRCTAVTTSGQNVPTDEPIALVSLQTGRRQELQNTSTRM